MNTELDTNLTEQERTTLQDKEFKEHLIETRVKSNTYTKDDFTKSNIIFWSKQLNEFVSKVINEDYADTLTEIPDWVLSIARSRDIQHMNKGTREVVYLARKIVTILHKYKHLHTIGFKTLMERLLVQDKKLNIGREIAWKIVTKNGIRINPDELFNMKTLELYEYESEGRVGLLAFKLNNTLQDQFNWVLEIVIQQSMLFNPDVSTFNTFMFNSIDYAIQKLTNYSNSYSCLWQKLPEEVNFVQSISLYATERAQDGSNDEQTDMFDKELAENNTIDWPDVEFMKEERRDYVKQFIWTLPHIEKMITLLALKNEYTALYHVNRLKYTDYVELCNKINEPIEVPESKWNKYTADYTIVKVRDKFNEYMTKMWYNGISYSSNKHNV